MVGKMIAASLMCSIVLSGCAKQDAVCGTGSMFAVFGDLDTAKGVFAGRHFVVTTKSSVTVHIDAASLSRGPQDPNVPGAYRVAFNLWTNDNNFRYGGPEPFCDTNELHALCADAFGVAAGDFDLENIGFPRVCVPKQAEADNRGLP